MAQKLYIRKDGVRGTLVDSTGAVQTGLQFSVTLGMAADLYIVLFNEDTEEPMTATELANYTGWNFVLADDFDQTTEPQIRINTGIEVISAAGMGIVRVTIPNTNTEGLATWLGTAESKTIGVELAGYKTGETIAAMVIQWSCVVYNRRDLEGGDEPEPIDPNYYTKAQVDALIAQKSFATLTTKTDASISLAASDMVIEWNPVANATLFSVAVPAAGVQYSWEVRLNLPANATLTLGSGISFAVDGDGIADAVTGGAVNILLVRATASGATVFVCGTEAVQ